MIGRDLHSHAVSLTSRHREEIAGKCLEFQTKTQAERESILCAESIFSQLSADRIVPAAVCVRFGRRALVGWSLFTARVQHKINRAFINNIDRNGRAESWDAVECERHYLIKFVSKTHWGMRDLIKIAAERKINRQCLLVHQQR